MIIQKLLEDWNRSIFICCIGTDYQDRLFEGSHQSVQWKPSADYVGKKRESVQHLVNGYEKLIQREYKRQHEKCRK